MLGALTLKPGESGSTDYMSDYNGCGIKSSGHAGRVAGTLPKRGVHGTTSSALHPLFGWLRRQAGAYWSLALHLSF